MTKDTAQTILIVDDIPSNIDILYETLKDDYRIQVALNGKEALEVIQSNALPDLILMDVMMPHMDGYEACKRLKEDVRSQAIPVIFVTARGEETDETQGFALGAVDYITKPINPAIVRARVQNHLMLYKQSLALEHEVQHRTKELYETRLEIVRRLGVAAEYKDNETGMHILRMSNYCRVLASYMDYPPQAVDLLFNASPMHDIGKIGIPDHILNKPGKLSPEEWEIVKTHTLIGAKIIGEHDSQLMRIARSIALTHHERWDGTGYPQGLAGNDIPIEGRITALADVFDALTSKRPYKEAWPFEKSFEHIKRGRGTHFSPDVVDAFVACIDTFLTIQHDNADEE